MEIIRAKAMGYCMGVKRAVESAENALDQYDGKTVYTFGPLIHNKAALNMLFEKGLKILSSDEIDEIDGENSVVVIRAHGITPVLRQKLMDTGCTLIDATCPRVLSSQKRARDFARRGFKVIIAGDKNHGEVNAIKGVVESENSGFCTVVENSLEASKCNISENDDVMVLSQTTFSHSEYDAVVNELKSKNSKISILNTICSATEERQNALEELCRKCNYLFVVGGKESANTKRLYEIANSRAENPEYLLSEVYSIEDLEELKEISSRIHFKSDLVAGITAGASTPESCIEAVENYLRSK